MFYLRMIHILGHHICSEFVHILVRSDLPQNINILPIIQSKELKHTCIYSIYMYIQYIYMYMALDWVFLLYSPVFESPVSTRSLTLVCQIKVRMFVEEHASISAYINIVSYSLQCCCNG